MDTKIDTLRRRQKVLNVRITDLYRTIGFEREGTENYADISEMIISLELESEAIETAIYAMREIDNLRKDVDALRKDVDFLLVQIGVKVSQKHYIALLVSIILLTFLVLWGLRLF